MLRLIDANLDRAREGLRVLEDIARFLLNDAELTQQLKSLRHELAGDGYPLQLLSARKAAEDVGVSIEATEEGKRKDLPALVTANARRVQESLRVLEEFAKLPSVPATLDTAKLQQTRFTIYALEQQLVFRLLRQDKVSQLAGLYIILDTQTLKGRNEIEIACQVIQGGATVIQLRDKQDISARLLGLAQELKRLCAEREALFIINDRLDLALVSRADGLHLGQEDLPVSEARRLLPQDTLLGCSTSTLLEACQAQSDGADYIAVGAIYPTPSKENFRLVGLERLQEIKQKVSLPVVAIGGINETNVEEVIKAGADSVAVISAVLGAEDVKGSTHQLATKIKQIKEVKRGEGNL